MQLKNAPSPILLNEAGKLIDINFLASAKALFPILVKVSGSFTEYKYLFP